KAQETCMRISYFGLNDSLHFEARYLTSLYSYLNNDFEESVSQLFAINQFLSAEYQIKSKLLYALSLNEIREWEKAEVEIITWVSEKYHGDSLTKDSIMSQLSELYKKKNHPRYRNPDRAIVWATFLPG